MEESDEARRQEVRKRAYLLMSMEANPSRLEWCKLTVDLLSELVALEMKLNEKLGEK